MTTHALGQVCSDDMTRQNIVVAECAPGCPHGGLAAWRQKTEAAPTLHRRRVGVKTTICNRTVSTDGSLHNSMRCIMCSFCSSFFPTTGSFIYRSQVLSLQKDISGSESDSSPRCSLSCANNRSAPGTNFNCCRACFRSALEGCEFCKCCGLSGFSLADWSHQNKSPKGRPADGREALLVEPRFKRHRSCPSHLQYA